MRAGDLHAGAQSTGRDGATSTETDDVVGNATHDVGPAALDVVCPAAQVLPATGVLCPNKRRNRGWMFDSGDRRPEPARRSGSMRVLRPFGRRATEGADAGAPIQSSRRTITRLTVACGDTISRTTLKPAASKVDSTPV